MRADAFRTETFRRRPFVLLYPGLLTLGAILCLGCGTDHGTIPVRGTVTFDGGPPPGPGKIMFTQIQAAPGSPTRPALARFGADGKYKAQTFKEDDGVFAGRYGVAVECWEIPPTPDGPAAKSFIPARYMRPNTSGFVITVDSGSSSVNFDIPLTSGK